MISLDIYSVHLSTGIDLKDFERENCNDIPSISFEVLPSVDYYIEFETGESFASSGSGERRGVGSLKCDVSLHVNSERRESILYYHEGSDHLDSSLSIRIFLSPSELDFIVENIQSGILPLTMSIHWHTNYFTIIDGEGRKGPENIIDYGWGVGDDSPLIWKNSNKENRTIELTSVSFGYSPLLPKRNEEGHLLKDTEMTSELGLFRQSIDGQFRKLRKSSNYILIMTLMVGLILLLK